MSSTAVPATGYEVHTGATIHHAYEVVFKNLQRVIEMAWLPFVLILAAEIVGMVLGWGGYVGHMMAWMLGALGFLVFGTTFGVRWLRHLLHGEAPSAELFPAGWRPLFFATITVTLLVFAGGVVVALVGMILAPIEWLIWAAGMITIALAALRILLMFPAAAIEQPIDVRTAWDMMAGNYWHFFACALICYVPFALIEGIIGEADSALPFVFWLVMEAIRVAVVFLGMACLYAMLADVYHGITGAGRGAISSAAA